MKRKAPKFPKELQLALTNEVPKLARLKEIAESLQALIDVDAAEGIHDIVKAIRIYALARGYAEEYITRATAIEQKDVVRIGRLIKELPADIQKPQRG